MNNLKPVIDPMSGVAIDVNAIDVEKPNMQRVGMGGSFLVAQMNFFLMLISGLLIYFPIVYCCNPKRQAINSEKRTLCTKIKLFFKVRFKYDIYVRFIYEGFLFVNILALMEISQIQIKGWNIISAISNLSACFALTLNTGFLMLVLNHHWVYRDYPDLEDEFTSFRVLYEGLKPTRKARLYASQFLLRRYALSLVAVFSTNAFIQMSVLMGCQLIGIVFMIIVRPFAERKDNILETINETGILFVCIMMTLLIQTSTIPLLE